MYFGLYRNDSKLVAGFLNCLGCTKYLSIWIFSYKKNVFTDLNIGSEADKSKVHTKINISLSLLRSYCNMFPKLLNHLIE